MTSEHTITAELELFNPLVNDHARIEVEITYAFTPGCPETGPTYSCGGTPAEPDEIEALNVRVIADDGIPFSQEQLLELVQGWIDGGGYDRAVRNATDYFN